MPIIDVKGVRNSWETVETHVVLGRQGIDQAGHFVIEQSFAFAAGVELGCQAPSQLLPRNPQGNGHCQCDEWQENGGRDSVRG